MNKLQILIFCGSSLLLSFGAAALLYPHATIPQKTLESAMKPQAMEDLPDINLGDNFGPVSVTDLVGYYIDHPPKPVTSTAQREQQFGGC
jgi:hypothetical protein